MFDNVLTDKVIINNRLNHCKMCAHNKLGVCSKCACIIEGKVRVKSSFCPVEKWGPVPND